MDPVRIPCVLSTLKTDTVKGCGKECCFRSSSLSALHLQDGNLAPPSLPHHRGQSWGSMGLREDIRSALTYVLSGLSFILVVDILQSGHFFYLKN